MAEEVKYVLNVLTVDNPLAEGEEASRFVLQQAGVADFDRVIAEMMAVNPGLERETVEAVVRLEHRVIRQLTLQGMRVNNGLFSAVASPHGPGGTTWDAEANHLGITLTQGAEWRDDLRRATVNVVGPKPRVMYIAGTEDVATRSTGYSGTPGRALNVYGDNLKVGGEGADTGIFLIDSSGSLRRVEEEMVVLNHRRQLTFILPADLPEGEYRLRVVTRYLPGGRTLKSPRVAECRLRVP